MYTRTILWAGIVTATVAGCSPIEPAPPASGSSVPPAQPEGGTADSAPAWETLELEPESHYVRTNTGSEPKFVFRIAVKYGPSEPYHPLLTQRARFIASDGAVTPATISAVEVKYGEPGLGHRVAVVPATPLAPSRWYRLEIHEDTKLAVRAQPGTGAAASPWSLAFFTSSAPHLTSTEWTAKSPSVLRLEFSEPLELGTVSANKLASQNGVAISKCILIGSMCVSSTATVASDVVVVQLTKGFDIKQPAAVLLEKAAMGAGQNVEDGSKSAAYDSESTSAGLVTTIGVADWTECQAGNAKCWAWHGAASK
ncbi:MAG: hypothetical protein HS104_18195 [Polyangiaceae bacterium]|nr:hypothetical protein [Polyangiaceae bacterium]MBK9001521.1 hypothetical protein [Myxococcales bacterium]MCL4753325.1 hypothetical protein [Myxococcales bacterium]